MGELLPTPDGTLSSVLRAVTRPDGVKDTKQVSRPRNGKYHLPGFGSEQSDETL